MRSMVTSCVILMAFLSCIVGERNTSTDVGDGEKKQVVVVNSSQKSTRPGSGTYVQPS